MENRLMTIVFIDMQGYTRRSATQTIDEMKLFHDQMFKFVSDNMLKWNGIMVKTMGDGFMVRFDSPTNAIQAGIEMQRRLDARNAQMMNPESLVRFRIGINTGEVGIDENGDLFGDPVNIAARIQTFADTNDVFISEATYLAMNRNEFGAIDLGNQDLKNATREIKIYKILKNGAPGVTVQGPRNGKNAAPVTGAHPAGKKLIFGLAIAGLIAVTLLAGYYMGRSGGKGRQPVPANKEQAAMPADVEKVERPIPAEPVKAPVEGKVAKTLLHIDPALAELPLDENERRVLADVQTMRKEARYSDAEKSCADMIYKVEDRKKVLWALALAEVFWLQKKQNEAEKIFTNINRSSLLPPAGMKRAKEHIELIRQL